MQDQKEKKNWLIGLLGLNVGVHNAVDDEDMVEMADNRICAHMQKCYPTKESQNG